MAFRLKKELREAFVPPSPQNRDSFLKSLPYPKLTYREFILSQIAYIRKRIWLVSALVLLAGVFAVCVIDAIGIMTIWAMSSIVPFLAVLTTAELSRSDIFGMAEIEAGCRFALPQVAGARMVILGICNFSVIAAVTVLLGIFSPWGIARSALYLLTPYLCVCGISLAIFNRARGREGVYMSGAAALAVGVGGVIFERLYYNEQLFNTLCLAALGMGILLTAFQLKKKLMERNLYDGIKA